MTQANQILEYIYIEYVSGPDFLARMHAAKSQSDIESVLRYSVKDAINSYGYRTDLWYDNVMRSHLGVLAGWRRTGPHKRDKATVYDKIFNYDYDPYFGEALSFDPAAFAQFIDAVREGSSAYRSVRAQIARFGDAGLRRAVGLLASEHKWTPIPVVDEADAAVEHLSRESEDAVNSARAPRKYLLSTTEGDRVVDGLRQLKDTIETADLDQADRTQALMLVDAALILSQAPFPNWRMVKELLYIIAAISTLLGFAIQIAELIK